MYIGNDIVCLNCPDNLRSAQSPRYRSRVLTDRESKWIHSLEDPALVFLQLWAAKESVYKILLKEKHPRFNVAKRIELNTESFDHQSWQLFVGDSTYYCRISTTAQYIHGVACTQPDWHSKQVVLRQNHHTTAEKVIGIIADHWDVNASFMYSDRGIPLVSLGDGYPELDISVSHDNLYFSCCYAIKE